MNDAIIRNHRSGFLYNDTLGSRFKFTGTPMIWEKEHVVKDKANEQVEYWVIKDEYGARMSCFSRETVEKLVVGERYAVKGEVKIGKGGMFLNLKHAEVLNGADFLEAEKTVEPTTKEVLQE